MHDKRGQSDWDQTESLRKAKTRLLEPVVGPSAQSVRQISIDACRASLPDGWDFHRISSITQLPSFLSNAKALYYFPLSGIFLLRKNLRMSSNKLMTRVLLEMVGNRAVRGWT